MAKRKWDFKIAPEDTAERVSSDSGDAAASAAPRSSAPSFGRMAASLDDALKGSVKKLDPALILNSRFTDRLPFSDEDVRDLAESIDQFGQLIPILVAPAGDGVNYTIIYGRRRLAAVRLLGKPSIEAFVQDLSEDDQLIRQGQENSVRKDLSWIEKALFASLLEASGKPASFIADVLNIDQRARDGNASFSNLSRMRKVTSAVPERVLNAIGSAHGVGRDRWYNTATSFSALGIPDDDPRIDHWIKTALSEDLTSDDRFTAFEVWVSEACSPLPEANTSGSGLSQRKASDRVPKQVFKTSFGTVKSSHLSAVITVKPDENGLHDWVSKNPQAALDALLRAQNADQD